ncbi:MAG TPA: hypothetical protein VFI52_18950 [Gemmatimonadaceae bacterium]|nr:hypothetical protein [Gemmatimonadaceae bacterium]
MNVGRLQRSTLSVLLFASVLAPVAATAVGWPLFAPPTSVIATVVAAALGAVTLRLSHQSLVLRVLGVALALAMAVPFAAILRAQSNAFYTSSALFGGMTLLLMLYVASRALRHVVVRDESLASVEPVGTLAPAAPVVAGLEHLPPNEIRVVHPGHAAAAPRVSDARPGGVPAVGLGDTLAVVGAWLLVLFWVLVALGHRHYGSGVLLLLGALLAMRCLTLLPEALATRATRARGARRAV